MTALLPLLPLLWFAAVGLVVGSFLNVCVARWPAEQSVVSPRSRCPGCGTPIAWHDNIPVLSWVLLRARCRACGTRISARYPAVELATGALWLGAALLLGPGWLAARLAIVATILLGAALTDAEHYLIPDGFTLTGFVFALGTAFVGTFQGPQFPFVDAPAALIGACAGAGVIRIIGWLGEVALKKEAMGFGDETLMAFVGATMGAPRALLTVFVGAALAAVLFVVVVYPIGWLRARARGQGGYTLPMVPFGVFLAPAALLTLLFGNAFLQWYLRWTMGA